MYHKCFLSDNNIMKNYEDLIKRIYACSKCGLCRAVCPVFELTKTEKSIPRGKFILANAVLKGETPYNKEVSEFFNDCLFCGKCTNFCPTAIETPLVTAALNRKYGKKGFCTFSQNFFFKILSFFTKKFKPFEKQPSNAEIYLFEDCMSRYVDDSETKSVVKIFEHFGHAVRKVDCGCCKIDEFFEGKTPEKTIKSIKNRIPETTKALLYSCDTCGFALKTYAEEFEELAYLKNKIFSVTEYFEKITKTELKISCKKPLKVVFHCPCRGTGIPNVLKQISKLQLVELSEKCCGFGGKFFFEHPIKSLKLMKKRANEIKQKNPEFVITTCMLCKFGLSIALAGSNARITGLYEFLNRHCKID